MAGAIDLLLYGVAIFISPVAVYFKKGVGAQFWVNCCLYCLLGVPGMLHAFYIIHTNKTDKRARHAPPTSSPQTQQRYSNLPSLPHPDRYRPPASYSPYEDHPPPVPPKREDTLPYDQSLHPNASGTNIGRAKAVLHTYQIPESTLQPPPHHTQEPNTEAERSLQPPPQLQQTQSEPPPVAPAAPNSTHSDSTLAYPAEYHPNAVGKNIANAKAVLHTYQIPETTFPAPEPQPQPVPEAQVRPSATATTSKSRSMWSLRNRDKGLSTLDMNSPTAVPSPASHTPPRPKWHTGPSWLRRRKNAEQTPIITTTTDEDDGPGTVTMVWDDTNSRFRSPNKSLGRASGDSGTHSRSASEPMALPFPMPPGSVRPVVDRTGTSNTVLVRPSRGGRSESGLGAVMEESPRLEEAMSEGEGARVAKQSRQEDEGKQGHNTDTEAARPHRLMNRLGRRVRPRLDIIGNIPAPGSAPVVPAPTQLPSDASPPKSDSSNQNRSASSPLSRHIAPPAVLASSIEEPRAGLGTIRGVRSNSQESRASRVSPGSPTRNNVDFRFAELGLGRAGDAYSAGSRALRSSSKDQERERRSSLGTPQGPVRSPKRLSTGTVGSPTSDVFTGTGSSTVPVIRRGLTQGTFGTGRGSSSPTSEGSPIAGKTVSKSNEQVKEDEELSQDEQIDRWMQRESERQSQPPTSHGHSSPEERHAIGPDAASLFSEESSGFAGIGVGSAHEKGQSGRIEIWDRPNWDGSDPSASLEASSAQHHHARYHDDDPFLDTPRPNNTHSPHATGTDNVPVQPLSPPTSPRPSHPNRPPPAAPQTPVQAKPATLRMDTFGAGERSAFGLLSPPATERAKGKGKERAIHSPPPVPTRPSASFLRPQSPKLPPKPASLRTMSAGEEDDLSAVYARALRDEL
ncbi:plasma membrane proteolipid [Ceratobasidium sp. AG-Ba]|nr:plasma membrane proteolipid [Ceratobasidium sp. AG-Ba]